MNLRDGRSGPGSGRRCASVLAAIVLAAAGLTGCGSKGHPDRDAAQAYLDAYAKGDVAAAAGHTTDSAAATSALSATLGALKGTTRSFAITGMSAEKDTTASANYRATWTFPGVTTTWAYNGQLALRKPAKSWQIDWAPTAVAPGLSTGQHLTLVRTQATRGNLLDSDGQSLLAPTPVVTVGIDPTAVTDLPTVAADLANVPQLSSTAAEITAAVTAAGKNFAPIITLRRDVYLQIRDQIYDLPGVQFPESTQDLAPTPTFAQPLLGRVGEAQADQIAASKGALVAGDSAGIGGLEQALQTQLAGSPGISLQPVDAQNAGVGTPITVSTPGAGKDVALTLNRAVQTAAETTVASTAKPAAVVVTQPSTGKLLAVAQNAAAIAMGDLALNGQFPPGSTFKMVTYTAAFSNDPTLTPDSTADCPGNFVYNGQTIRNENDFAKGTVPLSAAFAFSCNTTAANVALKLPAGALATAAGSLGLGQKWDLPVASFSGSMPAAATGNELAAEGYGQGKTLVSPALLAEIAGGAATGTAIAPSILVSAPGAKLAAAPGQVTGFLNTMMRDVVTLPGATGRDLAGLPGQIEGKTGTAEFGDPGQAHAWFAGTRGDIGFSVFVYDGGNSTDVSVPTTKLLLQNLPG